MADFTALSLSSVPMRANAFISTCEESFPIGSPLTSVFAGDPSNCERAEADSLVKANVIGFALFTGTLGRRVRVKQFGVLTLTAAQWAVFVTSDAGALVPGLAYYLSQSTPGAIRKTVPGTGVVAQVGIALSTTSLLITPGPAVDLGS